MTHDPADDEPTDWERMLWYLGERPRAFGLALATTDRLDAIDDLIALGTTKLGRLGVQVTRLELVQGRPLLEQLSAVAHEPNDVVFVTGLDRLLVDDHGGERYVSEIEGLNRARDQLPRRVPRPIIAWLTRAGARAFARAARDLNDVVITRYHFAAPPALDFGSPLAETRDVHASQARPEQEVLLDRRLAREPVGSDTWFDLAEERATLATLAHELDRATELWSEIARRSLEIGGLRRHELATIQLVEIALLRGDVPRARALIGPILDSVSRGDLRTRAQAFGQVARIESLDGRLDAANHALQQQQSIYEFLGDQRQLAASLGRSADVQITLGSLDTALALLQRALPLYTALGDARGEAIIHGRIADVLTIRGELDEALRIRRELELPTFARLGDTRELAITQGKLADALAARGDTTGALAMLADVLALHTQLGDQRSRAVIQARIGRILAEQGRVDEATAQLRDAIATFERLGDVRARAIAQGYHAFAQSQLRDPQRLDDAVTEYQAALKTLQQIGDPIAKQDVERRLRGALDARDDLAIARKLRAATGAHGMPSAACELQWGLVVDGAEQPLPAVGAVVRVGDLAYIRIENRGEVTSYVHVLDIGLRGNLSLLTGRTGIPLAPHQRHTLGDEPDGLIGLPLVWPSRLVKDRLRSEEIYAIATDAPLDLSALETEQLAARGGRRTEPSLVGWLLGSGDPDAPPPPELRCVVRRISFELDPGAA